MGESTTPVFYKQLRFIGALEDMLRGLGKVWGHVWKSAGGGVGMCLGYPGDMLVRFRRLF